MISLHLDPLLLLIWHPSMRAKQRESVGERERERDRGNKKGKIESKESKEKVRHERKLESLRECE